MAWIKKVGADFFDHLDVTPEIYIKEIVSGIRKFNEMAILLACISQGIHAMLLLHKNYWTTQCGQEYSMTCIKLAYVGSGNFKFFVPVHSQDQADFVDKADVLDKVPEPPTESDHDNISDGMEDLAETGLLPSDAEMQDHENSDANHDESSAITTDSRANDFVDESMDFSQATEPGKPKNMDTEDTEIADTSTENASNNPEAQTSTPPLQQTDLQNNEQGKTLTSTSGKTDSHDDNDGYGSEDPESDDSDVIVVGITVPDKPLGNIAGKVHRSWSYKCYLCGF